MFCEYSAKFSAYTCWFNNFTFQSQGAHFSTAKILPVAYFSLSKFTISTPAVNELIKKSHLFSSAKRSKCFVSRNISRQYAWRKWRRITRKNATQLILPWIKNNCDDDLHLKIRVVRTPAGNWSKTHTKNTRTFARKCKTCQLKLILSIGIFAQLAISTFNSIYQTD